MKVDATLVMVARRCARGGVRERTGRGSVEASKEALKEELGKKTLREKQHREEELTAYRKIR
jgi:hypothetical protein